MKKIIVSTIACCALIAPLAFAKDQNGKNSKRVRAVHVAFLTQQQRGVTVTAPGTSNRSEECMAAAYQPAKTLIIQGDGPTRYVLEGPGHVFNRKGEVVRTAIQPGTALRVYYTTDDAGKQTVANVVVD
jgi:hypothetical protein